MGVEYVAKLRPRIAPCKSNQEFGRIWHNSVVSYPRREAEVPRRSFFLCDFAASADRISA